MDWDALSLGSEDDEEQSSPCQTLSSSTPSSYSPRSFRREEQCDRLASRSHILRTSTSSSSCLHPLPLLLPIPSGGRGNTPPIRPTARPAFASQAQEKMAGKRTELRAKDLVGKEGKNKRRRGDAIIGMATPSPTTVMNLFGGFVNINAHVIRCSRRDNNNNNNRRRGSFGPSRDLKRISHPISHPCRGSCLAIAPFSFL